MIHVTRGFRKVLETVSMEDGDFITQAFRNGSWGPHLSKCW